MKVEISVERIEDRVHVKIVGDVDMNTSSDVRNAISDALRQGVVGMKALLVDLSQVRYMDSSGIATLVEVMQNCNKRSMRLQLCALSPPVRDVFELARLGNVFKVYLTVNDAVSEL